MAEAIGIGISMGLIMRPPPPPPPLSTSPYGWGEYVNTPSVTV